MNELRTIDPFALDPFDDAFRSLMRPWRMEIPQATPRIKIDLTEQEGSYARQGRHSRREEGRHRRARRRQHGHHQRRAEV
ncbi:hypothetical protein [Hydrogenophaga sp.]|uniref:hypothetical protein n=1 Tax=Hydrogenophaga sp. TaxID=1904254 RepID=UPI002731F300|nr:hypothetical protein [Hydrogenophaga sp.]MDP2075236.1 hypothetical protein [Hydrogenophaga sp.]MDP3109689.1 hypothetical protein [Hydrogenophaga sp.]MDP3347760.1 hypothetical protein [Hydrogenophaga sp.]MDZ4283570.1 hypothetical protein [Hydrogenophaga sp.]